LYVSNKLKVLSLVYDTREQEYQQVSHPKMCNFYENDTLSKERVRVLLNAPVMWNAVAFEERRLQWATMREKLGKDPSSR
jgi:hypothetical protein